MKRFALIAIVLISHPLHAEKIDQRLATVRKAWVEPVDELGDDKPVAACLGAHLSMTTPMTLADSKAEAEVVLRVKAHLPADATRLAGFRIPKGELIAQQSDGTIMWKGGANYAVSNATYNNVAQSDVPCGLADRLADKLRQAMRKARDQK